MKININSHWPLFCHWQSFPRSRVHRPWQLLHCHDDCHLATCPCTSGLSTIHTHTHTHYLLHTRHRKGTASVLLEVRSRLEQVAQKRILKQAFTRWTPILRTATWDVAVITHTVWVLLVRWKSPRHPYITWQNTVQCGLRAYNLTLNEAVDLAQNRPLWRLMSSWMALCTPSGTYHKRRRRRRCLSCRPTNDVKALNGTRSTDNNQGKSPTGWHRFLSTNWIQSNGCQTCYDASIAHTIQEAKHWLFMHCLCLCFYSERNQSSAPQHGDAHVLCY